MAINLSFMRKVLGVQSPDFEPREYRTLNERLGCKYVYSREPDSQGWYVRGPNSWDRWVKMDVSLSDMQPLYDMCTYLSSDEPPEMFDLNEQQGIKIAVSVNADGNPRVLPTGFNIPEPQGEHTKECEHRFVLPFERTKDLIKRETGVEVTVYDRLESIFLGYKVQTIGSDSLYGEEHPLDKLRFVQDLYRTGVGGHVTTSAAAFGITFLSDKRINVLTCDPKYFPATVMRASGDTEALSLENFTNMKANREILFCPYAHVHFYASEGRAVPDSTMIISARAYNDRYFTCATCSGVFNVNQRSRRNSGNCCVQCVGQNPRELLNGYRTDALEMFGFRMGDGSYAHMFDGIAQAHDRFLGLELELNFDKDKPAAEAIKKARDQKLAVICSDGSVDDGGEFKTPPVHEDYVIEHTGELMGIINDGPGFKANRSCGLHVHVTRSTLSELCIKRLLNFVYNPRNRAFMEAVAGRSGTNSYCTFVGMDPKRSSKLHKRVDPITKGRKAFGGKTLVTEQRIKLVSTDFRNPEYDESDYDEDEDDECEYREAKYQGVNIHPAGRTVEFRIFKGSTDELFVLSAIQFVLGIVRFCSEYPNKDYASFLAYITKQERRKEYLHLLNYLKQYSSIEIPQSKIIFKQKKGI